MDDADRGTDRRAQITQLLLRNRQLNRRPHRSRRILARLVFHPGKAKVTAVRVARTRSPCLRVLFWLFAGPPLLGWIGFACDCAIVVGLAALATSASSRLRSNPRDPTASRDGEPRLLVAADEHCGSPGLWREIQSRLADEAAVHVVVPVRVSHLHFLTNDEGQELGAADHRVRLAIGLLRQPGLVVTGGVGSDDPLESMTDALAWFPAPRMLLAVASDSYWLESDLLAKARTLPSLEVSQVIVPRDFDRVVQTSTEVPA